MNSDLHEFITTLVNNINVCDILDPSTTTTLTVHPKREDRFPYPPDNKTSKTPPLDAKQNALRRKVIEKEFWENF
jgi:hypothetical protein